MEVGLLGKQIASREGKLVLPKYLVIKGLRENYYIIFDTTAFCRRREKCKAKILLLKTAGEKGSRN